MTLPVRTLCLAVLATTILAAADNPSPAAIDARVRAAMAETRANGMAIAVIDDQTLRSVGLSGQKVGYLRDLSARIIDRRLQLDSLDALSDEDVIATLTEVKGFGRWTAEMFLMFRLHRPDVLPVGDLGILNAVQRLYKLRKHPTPKRLTDIGEKWRPYRSVACWYLWQTLRNTPQG